MDGKGKLSSIPDALQYMFIILEMNEEVFSILRGEDNERQENNGAHICYIRTEGRVRYYKFRKAANETRNP
jgi:hypothetical protein